MAFSESDRVKLRTAMGAPGIYLQAFPRLENAITAVQSIADGGTRPDNSTELAIKGWLTDLDDVETSLKALWGQAQVGDAKGVSLDAPRGARLLKTEGRRIIHKIASALSMKPLRDVFASSPLADIDDDDPFYG